MGDIGKADFRNVMGSFAAGVTVVTTVTDAGVPVGLTATAFSSLSFEPPLCLVCIDSRSASHAAILASRKFAVNMLASQQVELSNRFASRSEDKFEGLAHAPGEATGCPILEGVLASMECVVSDVLAGGDHSIFVGELRRVAVHVGSPLVYFRGGYRELADG